MPPSTYALAVPAALYQEAPPPWVLPPQPARDPTVGRYLHAKSAPTPTVEHEYELAEHAHRAATALGARGRGAAAADANASALAQLSRGLEAHPRSELLWRMYMACRAAAGWRSAAAVGRPGAGVGKLATKAKPFSGEVAALAAAEAGSAQRAAEMLEEFIVRIAETQDTKAKQGGGALGGRMAARESHLALDAALVALSLLLRHGERGGTAGMAATRWLSALVAAVLDSEGMHDYVACFERGDLPPNLRACAAAAARAPPPPPETAGACRRAAYVLAWRLTLPDTVTLWIAVGHAVCGGVGRLPAGLLLSQGFAPDPTALSATPIIVSELPGHAAARCGLLATAGGAAITAATETSGYDAAQRAEARKLWSIHCSGLSGKPSALRLDAAAGAALAPVPEAQRQALTLAQQLEEAVAVAGTAAAAGDASPQELAALAATLQEALTSAEGDACAKEYALWRRPPPNGTKAPRALVRLGGHLGAIECTARASDRALDATIDVALEGGRGWRFRAPLQGPLARARCLAVALRGGGASAAVEAALGALRGNVLAPLAHCGALGAREGWAAAWERRAGGDDWAVRVVSAGLEADATSPTPCVEAHVAAAAWMAAIGQHDEVWGSLAAPREAVARARKPMRLGPRTDTRRARASAQLTCRRAGRQGRRRRAPRGRCRAVLRACSGRGGAGGATPGGRVNKDKVRVDGRCDRGSESAFFPVYLCASSESKAGSSFSLLL